MKSDPGNVLKLGKFLKEFKRSGARLRELLLLTSLSALVAGFFLYGVIWGRVGWSGRIVLAIIGILVALPFIAGIHRLIQRRGRSLALYERGFHYRRPGEEFSTTWQEISAYSESTCHILLKNGDVFDLGNTVKGFEEVEDRIREELHIRILS